MKRAVGLAFAFALIAGTLPAQTGPTRIPCSINGTGCGGGVTPGADLTVGDLTVNEDVYGTQLAAPTTLLATGSTSTGSLPAGTYCYKITAMDAVGYDGALSNESCATIAATGHIDLTWDGFSFSTTGYTVYRGTAPGAENKANFDIDDYGLSPLTTFTDDGVVSFANSAIPANPGGSMFSFINNGTAAANQGLFGRLVIQNDGGFHDSIYIYPATGRSAIIVKTPGTRATVATISAAGVVKGTSLTSGTSRWLTGTGVPGVACAVGDLFSRTDGSTSTTLYVCTATNTWTAK